MAKKLKKNTGKGLIAPGNTSHHSVEETLRLCGALIRVSPKKNVAYADKESYVDANGSKQYLRFGAVRMAEAAQYSAVLSFLAERLAKQIGESDSVLAFPGEIGGEAFACMFSVKAKCGILYAVADGSEYRIESEVSKKEKVMVVLLTLSDSDMPCLLKFMETVSEAGGIVVGVACVVNDTLPVRDELRVSERRTVPVVSLLSPEIPKYRWDAPEVSTVVGPDGTIL
jgi:hypothetical protein